MKDKIIKFIEKPFIRNVAILTTGTAAAQAIGLIASPIITRLYGPEAFGIMGVFIAITQIIVPIASLTYPIAIVLPEHDGIAKRLIKLSLYISMGIASFLFVSFVFFDNIIIELFQLQEVAPYLYLIPLVVIFSGIMQVSEQWLIRKKQFGINAKVTFFQSLIVNASKIGIGFLNPVAAVLVILTAASNGIKALMMVLFIKKSDKKYKEQTGYLLSIKEVAKKYKDFPMYRAPQVLFNSISLRFPVLMLTTLFGPAAAGFYTIANTVLQKPIQLIGNSIGDVFYPRIAEAANNKENLSKLIKKSTLALVAVGVIPFGLVILFGPWLFSFVFGQEWITAGKYAQWLGLFLFCEFINKPSIKALPVLSAQLFHLNFTIITLILRIAALILGYFMFEDDIVAIALYGVLSAIFHIVLIFYVLKRSKSFDKRNV